MNRITETSSEEDVEKWLQWFYREQHWPVDPKLHMLKMEGNLMFLFKIMLRNSFRACIHLNN
jgi:hypothetical protein